MKTVLAIQITAFVLVAGAFGGVLVTTDVYERVQHGIVEILCLSCIKLDPKTVLDFTFTTATGAIHASFVLDNLSKGPVFLAFREDVCLACDIMEPVIQDIFDIYFEKEETLDTTVDFNGTNVTFVHINIDHASQDLKDALELYDKDHIHGVPQFTLITLGYDDGFIKPYYTSAYGTLNLDANDKREQLLRTLIQESIDLYNDNKIGYLPD